jgi:hypothetical protein
MDNNLKNAIAQGQKPTYFKNIKDAIAFADKLAAQVGLECGVHRQGKGFSVRQGWAQGGRNGSGANVYVARLKTVEQYRALGKLR